MEQNSHTNQAHQYHFDYIRVFAMLCVIFMHLASNALRVDTAYLGKNWHVINAATSLAFSAVPLFFMISGYLLVSSSRSADVGYLLKKRIPKLIVPLIVWSALAALWIAVRDGTGIRSALQAIAAMGSEPIMVHFWFMYTLIGMYLVSPVLHSGLCRLDAAGRRYIWVLLLLVETVTTLQMMLPAHLVCYLPSRLFSELSFFGGHLVSFVLGWLLGQTKRKIPNPLLIAVALVDWAFITFMTYRLTLQNGGYTSTYQSQGRGFEILLAACIFLLGKQLWNRSLGFVNQIISPLAALAFPVYLMHNIIISMMPQTWLPRQTAPELLFSTLLIAIVCYLMIKTAATIPPLCYITTGMNFRTACSTCNWVYTVRCLKQLLLKK